MPEDLKRQPEDNHGLRMCRAGGGLRAALPKVDKRLRPGLAEKRVARHPLDVLAEPVAVQPLEHVDDPRMERASTTEEETLVGDVVGQRVLERILQLGKGLLFI